VRKAGARKRPAVRAKDAIVIAANIVVDGRRMAECVDGCGELECGGDATRKRELCHNRHLDDV
jgi:hypothetical protein